MAENKSCENPKPPYRTIYDHRVPNIRWPEPQKLKVENIPESLSSRGVQCLSGFIFGFIGLGKIGSGIVYNLLHSGHQVVIWNRTQKKYDNFYKAGAAIALTPCDVAIIADITFCCVADTEAVKEVFWGNAGIIFGMRENKGFVDLSSTDDDTSFDIACALEPLKARYLEVRFIGSKKEAENGQLTIYAAGHESLYKDCESCFKAMSKESEYLQLLGEPSQIHMILQSLTAVMLVGMCEGLSLADACGLDRTDVMTLLKNSNLNCKYILDRCHSIYENNYDPQCSLKNLLRIVDSTLKCGSQLNQHMYTVAVVADSLRRAKRLGYGDLDCSALFCVGKPQLTIRRVNKLS